MGLAVLDLPRAAIVHRTLRFLGPVAEQTAVEFVEALELGIGARVLEAASGDAAWIGKVQTRWDCAADSVKASDWLAGLAAWRASYRPYDAVLDLGAPHPDATVYDHLVAAREVLRPAGRLLLGCGYWRLPPARAYLLRTGFARGAMFGLGATFLQARECGFRVRHWSASPPEAWEAYETGLRDRVVCWADEHAWHPRAAAARARAEQRHADWRREGRYVLGFALILLQAD